MPTSNNIQTKILQLQYLSCTKRQHQGQDLNIVCMNIECQDDRVLCCYCEEMEHQGHKTAMLKDYLMEVYATRRINLTQLPNPPSNHHPTLFSPTPNIQSSTTHTPQTNYLSFLTQIQSYKLSALSSLNQIRQRFLNQLTDIEADITSSAHSYMQRIKHISEINFGRVDLVERLQRVYEEQNIRQMNNLIGRYINDYNVVDSEKRSLQEVDRLIANNQRQHLLSTHAETHQQFVTIENAFKNKIKSFEHSLKSFDFQFMPKISKLVAFQDVRFKQFSALYDWDPNMMAKNFQIDKMNNKILRGIKNSVGCERFAFMKKIFPCESKQKFKWAIKIRNLSGWISVGIGLRKVISTSQLKFNYNTPGHGSYMISDNGYSWSHNSIDDNSKKQSFNFVAGDVIVIEFDVGKRQVRFRKLASAKSQEQWFVMRVGDYAESDKMGPCVNMCSPKDEVEIVEVGKG